MDSDLGELLDALDIEAWLDAQGIDYMRTRGRSGAQLNVKVCPVCGNSQSKVYLNADTGLGTCFAGSHPPGENFNKWTFIRATLSEASGRQVVDHIRSFVEGRGWTPKRAVSKAVIAPPDLILPSAFPLPYEGKNLAYLENRGITGEMAAYFRLMYCHEGGFAYDFDGQRAWMKFDNRVIIPVFDLDGKMVTFQGRDITGLHPKKYLFPPGLASTGSHLLNGMNVHNTKRIVIGEGAFDVIALKMALDQAPDLRDVVPIGTFGKHLSDGDNDSQLSRFRELKRRGVEDAVFMWDGEVAATDAAVAAGKLLVKEGFKVRIALLPKDKDPNEVPASVVQHAYRNAVPMSASSAIQVVMKRRIMNAV